MPIFSKESLETLRQRVDLVEVLTSHLDLKKSGAAYKGLCPFHDEKTPSFMIQKGDTHYHCFGCGAHGDAIQFLMAHLKMSFLDAVENLAHRFNVTLQQVEATEEKKGPNKAALKEALEMATRFYHYCLLHTPEGHAALKYLYRRGIDLDFIRRFRLGLASKERGVLRKIMHAKFIKDETMAEAGLIAPLQEGSGWRDFFSDRIMFPICDATGAVIGFSARKYKEETFGGKYINSTETPLFKKSRILFGLHHCRRRIAKERQAIIVEGQIDALKLIEAGFNITVAGQGTAFGEGHVKELMALGLNQVFLALDSDEAGRQAAYKIGDLFQCEGVEVRVLEMPSGSDPDSFLREYGPEAFLEKMHSSIDYLTFIVRVLSGKMNIDSPSGKNELVQTLIKQIRNWNHPLMVHESLRKLAHIVKVPEDMVGVGQEFLPPTSYIKKHASIGLQAIDPDRIWEADFLRWLLLAGHEHPHLIQIAQKNLHPDDLRSPPCKILYQGVIECHNAQKPCDLLSLAINADDSEAQRVLSELMQKKINREKAEEHFLESIQKLLDRNWTQKCEDLKMSIQSAQYSEAETDEFVKKFGELRRSQPKVSTETS